MRDDRRSPNDPNDKAHPKDKAPVGSDGNDQGTDPLLADFKHLLDTFDKRTLQFMLALFTAESARRDGDPEPHKRVVELYFAMSESDWSVVQEQMDTVIAHPFLLQCRGKRD